MLGLQSQAGAVLNQSWRTKVNRVLAKGHLDGLSSDIKNPLASREGAGHSERGEGAGGRGAHVQAEVSMWLVVLFLSPRFLCKALPTPPTVVLLESCTAGLMGTLSWFSIKRVCGILYASCKECLRGASYIVYILWRILHRAQSLLFCNWLSCGGPGLRLAPLKAKPSTDEAAEPRE